ncbi:MAG: hypothetical protein MHPSP_001481, partial [Paramarteilia canceri]
EAPAEGNTNVQAANIPSSQNEAPAEGNTNVQAANIPSSQIADITPEIDDDPSPLKQAPSAKEDDTIERVANSPPSLKEDFRLSDDEDSPPSAGDQAGAEVDNTIQTAAVIPSSPPSAGDQAGAEVDNTIETADVIPSSPPIVSAVVKFERYISRRLSQIKSDELSNIESEANNRIHEISKGLNNNMSNNQEEIERFIDWFKTSAQKLNDDQILAGLTFNLKNIKILNHNEKKQEIYFGDDKLKKEIMHQINERFLGKKTIDSEKLVKFLNDKNKNESKQYILTNVGQVNNGDLIRQINDIFRP